MTTIQYDDGNPTKNFGYDAFTDSSGLGYSLGQMTYANTIGGSGMVRQQSRVYDIVGRVSLLAECIP